MQKTKDSYNQRNKFSEKELKEFSALFLIINNLDIFRKNFEIISEINFSNDEMNEFKRKLVDYLLSDKFNNIKELKADDIDQKFKNMINLININAPVKIIYKNKNELEIICSNTKKIKKLTSIFHCCCYTSNSYQHCVF